MQVSPVCIHNSLLQDIVSQSRCWAEAATASPTLLALGPRHIAQIPLKFAAMPLSSLDTLLPAMQRLLKNRHPERTIHGIWIDTVEPLLNTCHSLWISNVSTQDDDLFAIYADRTGIHVTQKTQQPASDAKESAEGDAAEPYKITRYTMTFAHGEFYMRCGSQICTPTTLKTLLQNISRVISDIQTKRILALEARLAPVAVGPVGEAPPLSPSDIPAVPLLSVEDLALIKVCFDIELQQIKESNAAYSRVAALHQQLLETGMALEEGRLEVASATVDCQVLFLYLKLKRAQLVPW